MPSVFVPFIPPVFSPSLGVPALFGGAIAASLPRLVTGDAPTIVGALGQQRWGIFTTGGAPVLLADAVDSVEYARDYRISDYPQEQGSFESYNKVQVPYQAKVGFLIAQTRGVFLNSIEAALSTLNLVTIVTPEVRYASANLVHYAYRRTARKGVTMILVDVWCEEVRVTAQTALSNTQSQNGQAPAQAGQVQPDQTTTQTTNPITGQLREGLPNPITSTSPAPELPQLNVPPMFYDSSNIPRIPNAAAYLSADQQLATFSYGSSLGATAARASAPDPAGNVTVEYLGTSDRL